MAAAPWTGALPAALANPLISFRVKYEDATDAVVKVVELHQAGKVKFGDFLRQTELAYAMTEAGRLVHAARTPFVEEQFLVEGSLIRGPRYQPYLTLRQLLALPSNNGQAHLESRRKNTTSTTVFLFPHSLRPVTIKQHVQAFVKTLPETTARFEAPKLDRQRAFPAQSELDVQVDTYNQAFKPVNSALRFLENEDPACPQWCLTTTLAVSGEESQQDLDTGNHPDLEFKVPNTNTEKGGGEVKPQWILAEGRSSLDNASANLDRAERPLLIDPTTSEPAVNLVDRFNSSNDDEDHIRKALGQVYGYAKDGEWRVTLLTCDSYLWLMFMDPDKPEEPFLSEPVKSTDTEPTQSQVILYVSAISMGKLTPPTFPDTVIVPVVDRPRVQTRTQAALQGAAQDQGASGSGTTDRERRGCNRERRPTKSGGKEGGKRQRVEAPAVAESVDHGSSGGKGSTVHSSSRASRTLQPTLKTYGLEHGPNRGEILLTQSLASGYAGTVYRGTFDGEPVVVKTLDMAHSASKLGIMMNEIHTLQDMSSLWGIKVPRLLAYGPYYSSKYAIVLSEITGRTLQKTDTSFLTSAESALRSVHRAGYLHGDVRLENFLVDEQSEVFIIDFGLSSKSADGEAFHRELRQLRAILQQP